MAEFNKGPKQANDPSYIGYSKETPADTSFSGLVKDIGQIGITAVNTYDEIVQEQIKAEITAGNDPTAQGVAAADTKAQAASPNDDTESVDVFGEDKTSGSLNPEIAAGSARGAKLTQAYRQGKITPTAYWGQMAALSKSLKARYSGYEGIIDKQFQGITGQVPANALATAQRSEYLKGVATAASEEKQFNSFVKSNIQYLPADYFDRIKEGKPYSQLETYSAVHKVRSKEHSVNAQKDSLALAHASGNLTEEEAVGVASDTLNQRADAILADVATQPLLDGIKAAQAKGAGVTPQEKEQIKVMWGQLELKVQDALETELRRPTSDGAHTFYSLVRDPGKIKQIREQAMSRVNFIKNQIEDNNFGIIGATLHNAKAIQDNATNNLLGSSPYFAYADAANKNGGGPLIAEHFADGKLVDVKKKAGEALINLMMAKTASGNPEPTIDKIKNVMSQPASTLSTEDKKAVARQAIQDEITNIVSPNATQTSAYTAAENLYGKGNANFLQHFPTAQQNDYYGKLLSDPVTKKMAAVRGVRPDLWNQYRDWAKGSFISLQRSNAASISEGIENRTNINVTWNATNNQFEWEQTAAGKQDLRNKAAGKDTFLSGAERAFADDSTQAIEQMNRQIKTLEGVLKVDSKDVGKEIATLLGAMDIRTLSPKQKTFFQKAREAIDLELNPPEDTTTK